MSSKLRKILNIVIVILLVFLSYSIGYESGVKSIPAVEKITEIKNKKSEIDGLDFNIFWEAWDKIENKYVDRENLDKQKMIYGAINGMVSSLGDPYTSFFEPESAKIFKEDVKGSFSGIGAEIGFRKGILTIVSPLPDSPAEKAGIKTGDKVIAVDGESTQDMSLEEAVINIRGKKGTIVTLTILREEEDKPKEIKIKRGTIKIPTIKTELKEKNIAYIKLYNFTGNSETLFKNSIKELKKKGAEKFIIDLRSNPGGFLAAAIETASTVVPKGEVVLVERFGNGKSDRKYRSKGRKGLEGFPVVVLINGGSASASEIFAGAVKGLKNVKIVGEKSFGKGSVQEVVDLSNGTSLKVTIAKWLTPDGTSIQDEGITPDIEIKDNSDTDKDEQLDKALEVIKDL